MVKSVDQDIRNTRQRKVILEELVKVTTHPTADQIYDIVRRRIPRISLGTVYRNLDILVKQGLIQKLEAGGAPMRFDGNPTDHPHIRCIRCNRVDDLETESKIVVKDLPQEVCGYKVMGYDLEVIGLCPRCRE